MASRRWISVGLMLCVLVPGLVRAEDWNPLEKGMRWNYRLSGFSSWAVAGKAQTEFVKGTLTVEVRERSPELPQSPYEVVGTHMTGTDGRPETDRETGRSWELNGKQGRLLFAEDFDSVITGRRETVRYSSPLQFLPPDPRPGQTWHVGVEKGAGVSADLTGEVIGTSDVTTASGVHRGCLEVRYTGPLSGQITRPRGTVPIESGTVSWTTYYAPGVGVVLESKRSNMRLRMPDGQIFSLLTSYEYTLSGSSLLPTAPTSSD